MFNNIFRFLSETVEFLPRRLSAFIIQDCFGVSRYFSVSDLENRSNLAIHSFSD